MNRSNDRQTATLSMSEQIVLWCMKHGYPIPVPSASALQTDNDKYEGLPECFRNVIRTNNSKKLQYCKSR